MSPRTRAPSRTRTTDTWVSALGDRGMDLPDIAVRVGEVRAAQAPVPVFRYADERRALGPQFLVGRVHVLHPGCHHEPAAARGIVVHVAGAEQVVGRGPGDDHQPV